MKILLLLNEPWNDDIMQNNNMTNWFTDFENIEVATIVNSSVTPKNNICSKYFLIGEKEMCLSFFKNIKAGEVFNLNSNNSINNNEFTYNSTIKKNFSCEFFRLMRDIIRYYGKINLEELKKFILDFQPDIIFSPRYAYIGMLRLERIVYNITKKPMVIYTGDDDYSLKMLIFDPFFWIRRIWARKLIKQNSNIYSLFYCHSLRQINEFKKELNVNGKFITKCGNFVESKIHKKINNPIQLVYAGRLYCNRWKTLGLIANSIKKINEDSNKIVMQLNIYTGDNITKAQNDLLNDGNNSIIHGSVSGDKIKEILSLNDIVLHVEGLDLKNKLVTKDSFSTKIIDCLESGCALMAVCWEKQAGFKYLKDNDCAICASNEEEIYDKLFEISNNFNIILEYAQKAYDCGINKHQRKYIQDMLYNDFKNVIENNI